MSLDAQIQAGFTAVGNVVKTKISASEKGAANGVATLDGTGKIPTAQLPGYVDDVVEYTALGSFPGTGVAGIMYVALDTNKVYRWSGSAYIEISAGDVSSVNGKTGVVTLVKADIGLGSVDNTSDANKPISTATQTALDGKANAATVSTLITNVGATNTDYVAVFNAALV